MAKEIITKCKWFSGTVTGGGVLIQNGKSGLVGRAGGGQKERSHSSPTWISILFFSICMGGLLSDTRYLRWWALRQAPGIHWASQPWGGGCFGQGEGCAGLLVLRWAGANRGSHTLCRSVLCAGWQAALWPAMCRWKQRGPVGTLVLGRCSVFSGYTDAASQGCQVEAPSGDLVLVPFLPCPHQSQVLG